MSATAMEVEEHEDETRWDGVFRPCVLTDQVHFSPAHLTHGYVSYVRSKLQTKYCGTCSKFGFVSAKGFHLLRVEDPVVQATHLNGDVSCNVTFRALVCNPEVGQVLKGQVTAVNKFGVQVRCGPVECVVTKMAKTARMRSDVDLDAVSVGDIVCISVLGKRFEVGDINITCVGKLVSLDNLRANELNSPGDVMMRGEDENGEGGDDGDNGDPDDGDADGDGDGDGTDGDDEPASEGVGDEDDGEEGEGGDKKGGRYDDVDDENNDGDNNEADVDNEDEDEENEDVGEDDENVPAEIDDSNDDDGDDVFMGESDDDD